jgi:hypothetical protein
MGASTPEALGYYSPLVSVSIDWPQRPRNHHHLWTILLRLGPSRNHKKLGNSEAIGVFFVLSFTSPIADFFPQWLENPENRKLD